MGQQRACMPVYIEKTGDLVGWHRCLTHSQTENRATQLLDSIQFKAESRNRIITNINQVTMMIMTTWWCRKGLKDRHVGIPAYKSSATTPWSQSVHPSIASSIAPPWNTLPIYPIEIHHQMHLLQIHYRYKYIPMKCIANTKSPKWNTLLSIQQRQLNMANENVRVERGEVSKTFHFQKNSLRTYIS